MCVCVCARVNFSALRRPGGVEAGHKKELRKKIKEDLHLNTNRKLRERHTHTGRC